MLDGVFLRPSALPLPLAQKRDFGRYKKPLLTDDSPDTELDGPRPDRCQPYPGLFGNLSRVKMLNPVYLYHTAIIPIDNRAVNRYNYIEAV